MYKSVDIWDKDMKYMRKWVVCLNLCLLSELFSTSVKCMQNSSTLLEEPGQSWRQARSLNFSIPAFYLTVLIF